MPIHRHIKNVVHNYTVAERKVREATSNDPWGPSSTLMAEIADKTHNIMAFTEIMQMIWRRLNDKNKNWRHVYKALVLLEYIIKTGSDKVAVQCRENIHSIETLRDFEYVEEGKDHGLSVREKARLLSTLLRDEVRLQEERTKALIARDRLMTGGLGTTARSGGSSMASTAEGGWTSDTSPYISAGGGYGQIRNTSSSHVRTPPLYDQSTHSPPSPSSEMETARPHSPGEEQLQLQLALAMSKEEHEKEVFRRRAEEAKEEAKLQMVMEQSRAQGVEEARKQTSVTSSPENNLGMSGGNLFNLIDTSLSAAPADVPDPWATTANTNSNLDEAFRNQPFGLISNTQHMSHRSSNRSLKPLEETQVTAKNGVNNSAHSTQIDDPWATPFVSHPNVTAGPETSKSSITSGDTIGQSPRDVWALEVAFAGSFPEVPSTRPSTTNGTIRTFPSSSDPISIDHIEISNTKFSLTEREEPSQTNGQTKKRTPADFLGEHQGLVNLDKLVEHNPASTNPFATGVLPLGNSGNPFLANQSPKPSLNQLGSTSGPVINPLEVSLSTGIALPPPLQAVPTSIAKAAVASHIAQLSPAPVPKPLSGVLVPYGQPLNLPLGQVQTQSASHVSQPILASFSPISAVQSFPTSYPQTAQATGLNPFY